MRTVYLTGTLFIAFSLGLFVVPGWFVRDNGIEVIAVHDPPPAAPVSSSGDAVVWFRAIKPRCNTLEAELAVRHRPPPSSTRGYGFAAACFALAGDIDRAREFIKKVRPAEQYQAAGIVFEIGHPIADMGDDRSAGPMMELVVEFWPNHYMALYHAGIARYETGDAARAKTFLEDFLSYYDVKDGFRRHATQVVKAINR